MLRCRECSIRIPRAEFCSGRHAMGIDVPSMQLLCCAKNAGVDFEATCMIGRQTINASEKNLRAIFGKIGVPDSELAQLCKGQFAEPLFKLLGASEVASVDASDYEQATHIHDMNHGLPENLRERYSVVHEGGTIEHVFNIPQAFKDCMEMVRLGGHLIQVNVANNYMGHGFRQFSPELIYRVFSPENGFQIKAALIHVPHRMEASGGFGHWYAVQDPAVFGWRVELINATPTYIFTIAQRIARADIFASPPQQSDYVAAWLGPTGPAEKAAFSWLSSAPVGVKKAGRCARAMARGVSAPFDRPYYRALSDDDVVHARVIIQNRPLVSLFPTAPM